MIVSKFAFLLMLPFAGQALAHDAHAKAEPAAAKPAEAYKPVFKTELEDISYAIGKAIGDQMMSQGVQIEPKLMMQAIEDALGSKASKMTPEQIQQAMMRLQVSVREKQEALANDNLKKGDVFLAQNAKKKGVVTTASGL